jgi:hypothetical protein
MKESVFMERRLRKFEEAESKDERAGAQFGCHNIFIINLCKEVQNEKEELLHFVSTFV